MLIEGFMNPLSVATLIASKYKEIADKCDKKVHAFFLNAISDQTTKVLDECLHIAETESCKVSR